MKALHAALLAILAIAFFTTSRPASAYTTLGRTSVGTIASAGLSANFKRGSKFTIAQPGSIELPCAYLDGMGGVSGSQTVRFAVYKDANGVPGQKVGESEPETVTSHDAASWVCGTFDITKVAAGDYWFVLHSGAQGGIIRDYADGTGNWYGNADTFSDGASDPFGAGNTGNGTLSIFVYFTPASELDFGGRMDRAKTPSGGLTADAKRGSQVTISQAGRLDQLSLLIDTHGPTTGTQDMRAVLYTDASGKPGTKLVESDLAKPFSGFDAFWVKFQVEPIMVNAGKYWLVLHSGQTGGVIRDFGDGAPNFYMNSDVFSDGASQTFGAGNTGTGTLSGYVSYSPGASLHTKTFGRTTVGATPSGGMTADYKRASYAFIYDDSAVLTGLHAYLDGQGGASGSQQVRMAIYSADYAGRPQTRLAQSEVMTIAAGTPAGWVHFPVKPIHLQSYYGYFIAIQTGSTAGVARNYGGDGENNWAGNADAFADGAANQFGAAGAGTGTLSVYASYSSLRP
jgi:hypothetical protein